MQSLKYRSKGIFTDRKRSGRPKVTTSREDRLKHQVVTCSLTSFSKKIQAKLLDTGTAVSTKTIQHRLSSKFGLKSYMPARKPRLTKTMKKRLDFAKRHADWNPRDVKEGTFFR